MSAVSEMEVLRSLDILELVQVRDRQTDRPNENNRKDFLMVLWSLVQLYIVSDLVPRSEPAQIYAALFQNLHHKNINLTPIRLKHEQVVTSFILDGYELALSRFEKWHEFRWFSAI